jgi:hypothetical protein
LTRGFERAKIKIAKGYGVAEPESNLESAFRFRFLLGLKENIVFMLLIRAWV